jgi:hypothetical protein
VGAFVCVGCGAGSKAERRGPGREGEREERREGCRERQNAGKAGIQRERERRGERDVGRDKMQARRVYRERERGARAPWPVGCVLNESDDQYKRCIHAVQYKPSTHNQYKPSTQHVLSESDASHRYDQSTQCITNCNQPIDTMLVCTTNQHNACLHNQSTQCTTNCNHCDSVCECPRAPWPVRAAASAPPRPRRRRRRRRSPCPVPAAAATAAAAAAAAGCGELNAGGSLGGGGLRQVLCGGCVRMRAQRRPPPAAAADCRLSVALSVASTEPESKAVFSSAEVVFP